MERMTLQFDKLRKLQERRVETVLDNDRSLKVGSTKSQLPYVIQSFLSLTVPSKNELERLNNEYFTSGATAISFPISIDTSKDTKGSKLKLLSMEGYCDVSVLNLLFVIIKLFYNKIREDQKKGLKPTNSLPTTGNELLKELKVSKGGTSYQLITKRLNYLSKTALVVDKEVVKTNQPGLRSLTESNQTQYYIEKGLESTISFKLYGESSLVEENLEIEKYIKNSKFVLLELKLNQFLFEQLCNNKFRLIDLEIFNELKGNLAKIIYTYLIFHSQTSSKIRYENFLKKIGMEDGADRTRRKEVRRIIKKAFTEISEKTEGTIVPSINKEMIHFTFGKSFVNKIAPVNDFGICPECGKGRVIAMYSKKVNSYLWYCNRGKDKCKFVSDNEPKGIVRSFQ